ncbi:MAG: DUF438 domain-containing protein [Lutibacter sp.]
MNTVNTLMVNLPENHPIKVYLKEGELIENLLFELEEVDVVNEHQKYINIFNQLGTIEKRFARKENQLFPYLEKHDWFGPSQGMWSFHDNLRAQIKLLFNYNSEKNYTKIIENLPYLIEGIKRLMIIEKTRLFPNALELLTNDEWNSFYEGDEEIGWMLPQKPKPVKQNSGNYVHPSDDFTDKSESVISDQSFHFDEGFMTPDQVNLLLTVLPVDITYVDENDKVIFYNRGEERVFQRSKGIIGREVKYCHPPKSVGTVLKILEEFKSGKKNVAEFWLNFKGRLIHIRYFAVRAKDGAYKGVVEMSQDVTEIQKLEGEKRLLNWD